MSEILQPEASEVAGPRIPAAGVADDRDKSLDPRSVTAARISAAIWLMVLAAPFAVVGLFALFFSGMAPETLLGLAVMALAYAAFALWCLYWPGLRYRYASYRVGERGLWIRRGVFWRYEISVPRSRVQHTDVAQGPLQRRFDIATLVLHTAGTQNAAVALSGLPREAALAIRDHLIESGPGDAV